MGTDNKRPRDFRNYRRLFNKISAHSISNGTSSSLKKFFRRRDGYNRQRDCRPVKEGCYRGLFAYPRRVYLEHIHSSKEGQQKQACNRHDSAKQVRGVHPFQNRRHISTKICSQTGRFYDKTRFKGHISNCSSEQKIENLPSLHLEGCTLPIHLPPFQSLFLRQNFHQGHETSDCIAKGHGDQIINFSRQHGKLSRACNATHRLGNPGLNLLGVCDKLPKVHSYPFKGVATPGLRSKLRSNETFLAKRKAFKSKTICCRNHVPSSHCKPCSKFSWFLSVDHVCNSRNLPSHQGNTEGSHKGRSPPRATCFLQIKVTLSQEAINDLQ